MKRQRGVRRSHAEVQPSLFSEPEDVPEDIDDHLELQRDIHRMRLETSSNVYAQRRSQW